MRNCDLKRTAAAVVITALLPLSTSHAEEAAPRARRPSLPLAGVITRPDWVRRPTGEEMARYYPLIPMEIGLSGEVLLSCRVSLTGSTENCQVLQETPVGVGFGAAALKLGTIFQMKPLTLDGAPVSGAEVRIPVVFRTAADDEEEAPEPPKTPADPQALAFANRIVEALHVRDRMTASQQSLDNLRASAPPPANKAEADAQAAALAAVETYRGKATTEFVRLYAESLSRNFPIDQLGTIAVFLEGPAGQAWLDTSRSLNVARGGGAKLQREAVAEFCAKATCRGAPPGTAQGAAKP